MWALCWLGWGDLVRNAGLKVIYARLFREATVCSQCSQCVDNEIIKRPVPGMFDLRNFFSSSFTVSIMVLFLNNNLSDMLMSAPSYCSSVSLPLYSVDKKTLEQTFAYIPLSATSLPYRNSTKALCSRGFLSSTSPGVIMKFRSSPFPLHTMCSLKPKN